jgi:hypothetical protein
LKSLLNGNEDDEFPFELSAQELEVVRHFSTSTLILGRSGTGKTSCLLFKLLAKHMLKKSASEGQHAKQVCSFFPNESLQQNPDIYFSFS